jgi:hypothetical protein
VFSRAAALQISDCRASKSATISLPDKNFDRKQIYFSNLNQ